MLEVLKGVGITDWLTIAAILFGPIVAIRIQKFIERQREHNTRQLHIFRTLMATRASRLSTEHVTALNMIDMDFSEKKKKEKPILRSWRVLLDQFGKYPQYRDYQDQNEFQSALRRANEKADEYLIDLLYEMSTALRYDFEKIHIKNGIYAPTGHAEIEHDQSIIRKAVIGAFTGKSPINMNVTSLPEQIPHESVTEFLRHLSNRQEEILEIIKKIIEEGHISFAGDKNKVHSVKNTSE
jgi:hypothetical protein